MAAKPISRKYPFLYANPGVDWRNVNPALLERLNRLGASLKQIVTLTSGRRTTEEQAKLYQRYVDSGFNKAYIAAKPGESRHEQGSVVDAYVNGKPIWDAVGEDKLKRFGFTHLGAPAYDRPHIGLADGQSYTDTSSQASASGGGGGSAPQSAPAAAPPDIPRPFLPTDPAMGGPDVSLPGTEPHVIQPLELRDTWQQLASDPFADEMVKGYARTLAS